MKRRVIMAVCLLALAGCSTPLDLADWIIPVAEGVPVHEYAQVPLSERSQRIELASDLVIGERDGDGNYTLYNAFRVLAGPDGRIYVLDSGNSRVQVFGPDGEYLMTMGREGQGPGEFTDATDMTMVADRLLVRDFRQRRYSVWTLDGEHVGEVSYPAGPTPLGLAGVDDGTFIGRLTVREEDANDMAALASPHYKLVRYDLEAEVVNEVLDLPPLHLPAIGRQTETSASFMRMRVPAPSVAFAATRDGMVYASLGEEYQVWALDAQGAMRWALRVAWQRVPISEEEIVSALQEARERIPDVARSEVDWPAARPALLALMVDGHGHVYVLPFPESAEDAEDDEVAVDVYDADGRHLFSGTMPDLRFTDARGDFVYAHEADEDTGEERVIRYRLVEPW